jgi:hypothetical protein
MISQKVYTEPLSDIIAANLRIIPPSIRAKHISDPFVTEMILEGFPLMTSKEFVEMFCEVNNCEPDTEITRILFDYVGRIA